jgi:hypothetical protein
MDPRFVFDFFVAWKIRRIGSSIDLLVAIKQRRRTLLFVQLPWVFSYARSRCALAPPEIDGLLIFFLSSGIVSDESVVQ